MRYAYAVYKTADSSTTFQMSNRVIVEHLEQMRYDITNVEQSHCGTSRTDEYIIRIQNLLS